MVGEIGRRIAAIREARGESLREAALRTGVSHTTIARIEKGEVTGSFHSTLQRIAAGYGVKLEYLLTGRDPRREFEQSILELPPDARDQLYFVTPGVRVGMVLRFLLAGYRSEIDFAALACTVGWEESSLFRLTDAATAQAVPLEIIRRLAGELTTVTGIAAEWFEWGIIGNEPGTPASIGQYLPIMRRASEESVPPHLLEAAIDLLIARHQGTPGPKKR